MKRIFLYLIILFCLLQMCDKTSTLESDNKINSNLSKQVIEVNIENNESTIIDVTGLTLSESNMPIVQMWEENGEEWNTPVNHVILEGKVEV